MREIKVLSKETVDQIAAGEVVERPSSVVKELIENAIDAGATAVTCEIQDGGTKLIRITDNGEGIAEDQIRNAFLPHATSKIRSAEDLALVGTLGFRGEALSSISAVARVELITKTPGALVGCRYRIEGGEETGLEEIGAPEGSTFIVRDLFYNVPARKKFLRSTASEAGSVSDLIEHMALSNPGISFKFIVNGQVRLHTSGNHSLKDIIYSIYGRDTAANLLETEASKDGVRICGVIGKPVISRGNRGCENYFVNGRFIRSNVIAKAVEEGYRTFLMQHRYPFTVLFIEMDGTQVDVNVHPAKMEVRFADAQGLYDLISAAVRQSLTGKVLIPKESESAGKADDAAAEGTEKKSYPEPFENMRRSWAAEKRSAYEPMYPHRDGSGRRPAAGSGQTGAEHTKPNEPQIPTPEPEVKAPQPEQKAPEPEVKAPQLEQKAPEPEKKAPQPEQKAPQPEQKAPDTRQMELFGDTLLTPEGAAGHRLIGQVFDTYWIVEYKDSLYIIDQHAAHEKVMYERLCAAMKEKTFTSQMVSPPILLTLRMQEAALLEKYQEEFKKIGFEIEHFGGTDYAISAVPANFYGFTDAELFAEMLDQLRDAGGDPAADLLYMKLAGMACKSAVKGNSRMSVQEADALISELLSLENPYNCPHGRPTIIEMTKTELEKKFRRIV